MTRTIGILQARMGSTRLPGKILQDIQGKPLLQRVAERARKAQLLDALVIATTDKAADDAVVDLCKREGLLFFRGSEDDVLDRYYQTACAYNADVVVRSTADCPLLDAQVTDLVIREFFAGDYDYVSNVLEPSYPDGLDTEVFSLHALERAWREAELTSEREHVTPFLWKHGDLFRLQNVKHVPNLAWMRWTVDEPDDLEFVRAVYQHFGEENFGMNEILTLLAQRPDLQTLNAGIERNEGYFASLRKDKAA